jgi:hypothetical protein
MTKLAITQDQLFRELGHIYYEFKSEAIEKTLCGHLAAQYPDGTIISVYNVEVTANGEEFLEWLRDYDYEKVLPFANATI